MSFPNAYQGVKKIFTAEIMALISTIVMIISAIVALVGIAASDAGAGDGAMAVAVGGAAFILIGAVLSLISFILNIVGVNKASKDEAAFKSAFYVIIVGIIASVVMGLGNSGGILDEIGQTVSNICNFLVTWYVCTGIANLAEKLSNPALKEKAEKTRKLTMIVWVLNIIVSIIGVIFGASSAGQMIGAVLGLVSLILALVAYIMYLGLLSKAKKSLA